VQLPDYMHIVKVAILPWTIVLMVQSASVESAWMKTHLRLQWNSSVYFSFLRCDKVSHTFSTITIPLLD
jgi:hypothetical protein